MKTSTLTITFMTMKFDMKHFTLILFLFLGLSSSALAQPGEYNEKIEQLRIAFLTEELDLTTEEGQAFWPLFNEFNDGRKEINKNVRKVEREVRQITNPSEADVMRVVKARADGLREQADLEEDFIKQVLPILGVDRTMRLMESERKFKREVLEKIRERRGRN